MKLLETYPRGEEIAFLKNTYHLNEIWNAKLAYSSPAIFRSVYVTFFEVKCFLTLPLRSQETWFRQNLKFFLRFGR